MVKGNFTEEFKRDAVRQITERGYPVAEVSQRLGVTGHVSSPILACSVLTSTVGPAGSVFPSSPKTPVAPSRSWSFQCLI